LTREGKERVGSVSRNLISRRNESTYTPVPASFCPGLTRLSAEHWEGSVGRKREKKKVSDEIEGEREERNANETRSSVRRMMMERTGRESSVTVDN